MGLLQDFGILTVKERIELGLTYTQARTDYLQEVKYAWKKKNPEKVMANQTQRRACKKKKPEVWDAHNHRSRLNKHKLTETQFESMMTFQQGHCALCPAKVANKKGGRLYIDHDHITGRVRGLLCTACNFILGYFEKDRDWNSKAEDYLKRNMI